MISHIKTSASKCVFLTYLNVVFDLDADTSEDSSPPLPERTPESFILASEPSEFLLCCVIVVDVRCKMHFGI